MVAVHILDTSTATVAGTIVAGPATFDASAIDVAGLSYTSGVILVQSGAATVVAELHPSSQAMLAPGICVLFVLGLLWSRCTA